LLNRELGINKVSDSDPDRDLNDNNGLYYGRISIDDKQDLENVSFRDNK
jgi:hypothetical protein